ncbi:MAG: CaiB/BaiF CoA transferase family protein [Alphaproteobacteria bacterium]
MTESMPAPLLSGVTIVDLSHVLAGPFATMTLANLGARVIKVEIPGAGDDSRAFGPFRNGKSLYFSAINCNKESIALNLKAPEDRALLDAMLAKADVVVENFRPGTMERLGLGWETLHARFPRLIYGAASGFGTNGPLAQCAAYDMVVQGMGGIMSLTGPEGGPPVRVGASVGDLAAGLYLAIGLNAALYRRAVSGVGCKLDIAMLDCQVALLEDAIVRCAEAGRAPAPHGTRHPSIAPFQTYRASDRPMVIAAANDRLFARLAQALGRPEWAQDPRFLTNTLRHRNVDALEKEMESVLAGATSARWIAVLTEAGVPCGPVNDVAAMMAEPQVAARNMIVTVDDPVAGPIPVAGNPIKVVGLEEPKTFRPAPALDADRNALLREFAPDASR